MPAQRAGSLLGSAGGVSPVRPCRPGREELVRLDPRVLRQLRLAASGEEVDEGEAEDAQRGRDGESVEEPPQVRVWMVVVKRCHPSDIHAGYGAILPRVHLTSRHTLAPLTRR